MAIPDVSAWARTLSNLGKYSTWQVVITRDDKEPYLLGFGSIRVLLKVTVKEVDLYSTFIEVPYTQGTQVWIAQCYL